MGNLVKYGDYSMDAAEEEAKEIQKSGGAGSFMKLEEGDNTVRFLPPPVGQRSPFMVVFEHFVQVPGASGAVRFACPRMNAKLDCPACDEAERLRRSGRPADKDRGYEMLAKRRVYANAVNRAEPERGPLVLAFGKTIHEKLVNIRQKLAEDGNYVHPVSGFDIVITRRGTGKQTEYEVVPARKNTPLAPTEARMSEWIEGQTDLSQFGQIKSWDEIKEAMSGGRDDSSSRGRPSNGRAVAQARPANADGGGRKVRRTAEDDMLDVDSDAEGD